MRWSTCNLCSEVTFNKIVFLDLCKILLSILQTFALTKDLLKHNLEVHKEIRPHKCSLCPAQFNHKGHLRSNGVIHFLIILTILLFYSQGTSRFYTKTSGHSNASFVTKGLELESVYKHTKEAFMRYVSALFVK